MEQAKWIWYHGDYEIYHNLKLHARRTELGVDFPAFWGMSTPYPSVVFYKKFYAEKRFPVKVVCKHYDNGRAVVDGKPYSLNTEFSVDKGEHEIYVEIIAIGNLPTVFIDSEYLKTGSDWLVSFPKANKVSVGCEPAYTTENDDPEIFPFKYEKVLPVAVNSLRGGYLYDFGKETFCRVTVKNANENDEIILYYGESEREALDHENTIIQVRLTGKTEYVVPPKALRFLHVTGCENPEIIAELEYLPTKTVGEFSCNDKLVNKIYETAVYTLSLNSRECYLDGIKRDRWVWSGDAYQSYMANRYLTFDKEIIKRTIVALLGKPPYVQHVNTINDYSMYVVISVYEYYLATLDAEFVKTYFDRITALYDFISSRTENGYVVEKENDWVFIDWSDMDKSDALCAEQILFWKTKLAMATLFAVCGKDGSKYEREAKTLKNKILKDFWREDKFAFVDCFASGRRHVTRHANIFAILYDFVSEKKQKKLVKSVLNDDTITPITTPYFEFFELCARCKTGDVKHMQNKVIAYWGGMIKRGATSIWEKFDPTADETESLAMYGNAYGCSLCHAWGAGPVYLMGRYSLGVSPTSAGYKTFTVKPETGKFKFVKGVVPLPDGKKVSVYADKKEVRVLTDAEGGTLVAFGKEYTVQ
ncbi:MAG: alpha-rhamnosidase, partial [Clostridia bacterium]|nr:alpha-rhamnosidase [Clostridia bacterium]